MIYMKCRIILVSSKFIYNISLPRFNSGTSDCSKPCNAALWLCLHNEAKVPPPFYPDDFSAAADEIVKEGFDITRDEIMDAETAVGVYLYLVDHFSQF